MTRLAHLAVAVVLLFCAPITFAQSDVAPLAGPRVGAVVTKPTLVQRDFDGRVKRLEVPRAEAAVELPAAAALVEEQSWRGRATVRVVRDANPDGSAAGSRENARGVDLNRNWPARNFKPARGRGPAPLSEPESSALHADIMSFRPDIVVVFHSARSGPFVNFDGPAAGLAAIFAESARAVDPRWRTVASMGYPTPGSLGSFVGVDGRIPILTIEFQRGHDARAAAGAALAGLGAVIARVGEAQAGAPSAEGLGGSRSSEPAK